MSGKMSDGLLESNQLAPDEAPAKTVSLTEEEVQKYTRLVLRDEDYMKELMKPNFFEEAKRKAASETEASTLPFMVETSLLKVAASYRKDQHHDTAKVIEALVEQTIPRYRPDLYAAHRYCTEHVKTGYSKLTKQDAIALFVYTIELTSNEHDKISVKKLNHEDFMRVLEKLLRQKELEVVKKLEPFYQDDVGQSLRAVFHRVWDELEQIDAEIKQNDGVERQKIQQGIAKLEGNRMSREVANEFLAALKKHEEVDGNSFLSTAIPTQTWMKLKEQDLNRLQLVQRVLQVCEERYGGITLGSFGLGSSISHQIYGRMNASLRTLESACSTEAKFLKTLRQDLSRRTVEEEAAWVEEANAVAHKKMIAQKEFNRWKELFFFTTEALDHLPIDKEHDVVYRGINFEFKESQGFGTGKFFAWPSFSSTSATRSEALKFAASGANGTLFVITGQCTGRDVKLFSKFPEEDEVLLPPQSYFQVVHRTTELENIVNRSGPIITVRQLDLKELDRHVGTRPSARMLWIMNFGSRDAVPFSAFEKVHIEGNLGPDYNVVKAIWRELKYGERMSDVHSKMYGRIRDIFSEARMCSIERLGLFCKNKLEVQDPSSPKYGAGSPPGNNEVVQVTKTDVLKASTAMEKRNAHSKTKTPINDVTVTTYVSDPERKRIMTISFDGYVVELCQLHDYCDVLESTLRHTRRQLECSFVEDDHKHHFVIADSHANHGYLNVALDAGLTTATFYYDYNQIAATHYSFTIGNQLVAFIGKEKYVFSWYSDASTSHFIPVPVEDASRYSSLICRSPTSDMNSFFLYMDSPFEAPNTNSVKDQEWDVIQMVALNVSGDVTIRPEKIHALNVHDVLKSLEATWTDDKDVKDIRTNAVTLKLKLDPKPRILNILDPPSAEEVAKKLTLQNMREVFLNCNSEPYNPKPTGPFTLRVGYFDRNKVFVHRYIPYPLVSLTFYWSHFFWPISTCLISMGAILTVAINNAFGAPAWALFVIIAQVFLQLGVIVAAVVNTKDILKEIALSAPHASATRGRFVLGGMFAFFVFVVLAMFTFFHSFPDNPVTLEPPLDDILTLHSAVVPILFVPLAIQSVSMQLLFILANQTLHDRATNYADELRNAPAADFVGDAKILVGQYLALKRDTEAMQDAWKWTMRAMSIFILFCSIFFPISIIVSCLMQSQMHFTGAPYTDLVDAEISITFSALVTVLVTIRRWEDFPARFCRNVRGRYEELAGNPDVTPATVDMMIRLFSNDPLTWPVDTIVGKVKITGTYIFFFFAILMIGSAGQINIAELIEPPQCTIATHINNYQTFALKSPHFGDPNVALGKGEYLRSVSYGFGQLPAFRSFHRTFSCTIDSCARSDSISLLMPKDISPSYCNQMFQLKNASYDGVFTNYQLMLNTQNPVWKSAQEWVRDSSTKMLLLRLRCDSEATEQLETVCIQPYRKSNV